MKKIVVVFMCFILMSISLYADDSMKVKAENIEVDVPVSWLAQYTKSPQIFFLFSPLEKGDNFQENGNLMKEAVRGKSSLKNYMDESVKALKTVYKELKIEETGTNYHILSGILNNIRVKQIQYLYIKDNNIYILTFTATPESFAKFSGVFKKIAESLKIN